MKKNVSAIIIITILIVFLCFVQVTSKTDKEDSHKESYRFNRQLIDYDHKIISKGSYINDYTGVAKDKSLILVGVENFDQEDLDQLEGYRFRRIYANMASVDRRQEEFSVLYGFYPHHLEDSYTYYDLSGLGLESVLEENGYEISRDLNNFKEEKNYIYLETDQPIEIYKSLKEKYPQALICIFGKSKDQIDTSNLLESINIPLLIDFGYTKDLEVLGGQIDLMETLLNLLGIKTDVINLGIDLLDPIEAKLNYVIPFSYDYKGTFITEEGVNIGNIDQKDKFYGKLNYYGQEEMAKKVRFDIDNSHGILEHRIDRVYANIDRDSYENMDPMRFIMHAGGAFEAIDYTNTKEVLDRSYENGRRLLEIDLVKTKDGRLVASHDWRGFIWKFYGKKYQEKRYSHQEFMNFESVHGLSQMDIDSIMAWLRDHPDAYIITDIKEDNVKFLKEIKEKYPAYIGQLIPQIYSRDQYEDVRDLGYENIIYTLYMSPDQEDEVIDFVNMVDLFALTMSADEYEKNYKDKLDQIHQKVYIHTINDCDKMLEYLDQGVYGIYTDIL